MRIRRGKNEFTVQSELKSLTIDQKPMLIPLNSQSAILEISSFRREYFKKADWVEMAKKLSAYKNIIIDLRGNRGGDFGALARALSTFHCEVKTIGVLESPRAVSGKSAVFVDDSEEDPLIELVGEVRNVEMQRFLDYPCVRGELAVLIDRDTKSVAEVFTGLLKGAGRAKVYGQKSGGETLVGVWYELRSFAAGFTLSIPEALFVTNDGLDLEGKGVWPDQLLYYEVKDLEQGKDSWVKAVGFILQKSDL
jgi:C-terminal processing protease CtpA/Prc